MIWVEKYKKIVRIGIDMVDMCDMYVIMGVFYKCCFVGDVIWKW